MQNINDLEDNPFTISVDITAAGVANNCLTADESGYSYPILQNDAVLGVVPELSYSDGLTVSDVIINFNIVDSAVSDRIGAYSDDPNFDGINRFNIFKYFEDTDFLLPIETFYNEETNTVYTHVDELGSYCLVDMEVWMNNIENAPAGKYYNESDNEPANIVFCLDTRDIIDSESFNNIKADIKTITDDALNRYDDVKVYVYYQRFGSNFKITNNLLSDSKTGKNYFIRYEDAEKALDSLERYLIKSNFWAYDYVEATQFMIDTCDENIIAMYHVTADDRIMGSVSGAKRLLQIAQNSKYTTKDENEINRIYVSLICPNCYKVIDPNSYVAQLVEATGGIIYTAAYQAEPAFEIAEITMLSDDSSNSEVENDEVNEIKESITSILGIGSTEQYHILTSTGDIDYIKLDKKLIKGSKTDTDNDNSPDWEEVNTRFIAEYMMYEKPYLTASDVGEINNSDLPTISYMLNYYNWKSYMKNVPNKLMTFASSTHTFFSMRLLPIVSNPVDPDSDNDGIPDFYDLNALYKGDAFADMEATLHYRQNLDNDTFTVIEEFKKPITLMLQPDSNIQAYSLPKMSNKTIFTYSNEVIHAYCVIKTMDCYWIKVKNDGKMGYIKWDDNIIDTFSVVDNAINQFETKNTKLLLSHDDIVNALKESYCLKGDESIENINSKLKKTSYDDGEVFSYKGSPYGVIKNSKFAYLDQNSLYRVEISNSFDNTDFYAVAISDQLMKMAYDALKDFIPDAVSQDISTYNGFKFLVKLVGDNGEVRYINMISSDTKSNLKYADDKDEGNSLFPVSRDHNNNKQYDKDGSVQYHDHLFEFVPSGVPGEFIATDGNVDYDKLFDVPEGTNLKVYDVYLYIDKPLVRGEWGGYYDYNVS